MIRAIIKFALNVFFTIYFRIEKKGQENLPKEGAYILAPKHLSNWDGPVVVAKTKRNDVYVLAKQELFVNGFVKFLAKKVHALPVKRNSKDTSVVKESVKALKQGNILLVFPEGTRNGIEKHGKIHSGAVIMANMANVPIVPVGIQATYKPFSKVIINYGKPIDLRENKLSKEEIEEVTKKLQDDIIELTNGEKSGIIYNR
jgi:1-acyl-sn-glycerol-3-phosphate acyltransferase